MVITRQLEKKPLKQISKTWRSQAVVGVGLGILGVIGAIAISWLLGENTVSSLFAYLHYNQENPPFWIAAPQFSNQYYLLAPTIILFAIAQTVIKLSPKPRTWSRVIVVSILLALVIRYVLWRTLSSLNLSNPVDGLFSLALLVMESLSITTSLIGLYLMLRTLERHDEADKYSEAVEKGIFNPSVDILIPTYNEPDFILRRTIVGCLALDYDNKNIYLLDDTKRSEIKKLAQELGINYITRPNNLHAKAGNLNHAIALTKGELIVVFDADFVPTKNFLTRTVGFFQKSKIALVQTPQSFYNVDPIATNLGLQDILTPDEEIFYRQIEPFKDAAGSVVCAGTSFVVRRSALEEVGYFVTDSICEDYFTGIRISALGYELVYLNEKLSAGLAAESIASHVEQRLRWGQGTLQAFFINSNPLTIKGLNLRQRLAHLEGLLSWLSSIPRVFFLLMPLLYLFFDIIPIKASTQEFLYIILPFYILNLAVFGWLNQRSRSALFTDVYVIALSFPVAVTVIQTLLNPFRKGFKVTPKGISRDKYHFHWHLAIPLIVLLITTVVGFCVAITKPTDSNINLGLIWSAYNILTISVALVTLLDVPKPNHYDWFKVSEGVWLNLGDRLIGGKITQLSEVGAQIELRQLDEDFYIYQPVNLEVFSCGLKLAGSITDIDVTENLVTLVVKFENLTTQQINSLIEIIFSTPNRWMRKNAPGEWRSLYLMIRVLFTKLLKM